MDIINSCKHDMNLIGFVADYAVFECSLCEEIHDVLFLHFLTYKTHYSNIRLWTKEET